MSEVKPEEVNTDEVARDALKAILGDQPEWRDDERWWMGAVRIANRLLEERAAKEEELQKAYRTVGTLRRVIESGISEADAEELAREKAPIPILSMRRWREIIRKEAERRREAGTLHMENLAKEAGISVSTLQRILKKQKKKDAQE